MPPQLRNLYNWILLTLEISMLTVIFAFLFVDLFDTSGICTVTVKAGLMSKCYRQKSDSTVTIAGSMLGTSTTTPHESVAGVSVGGRTGLTAVVVALFLLMMFFAPQSMISYATAGAILYVAVLMMQNSVGKLG